jgi:vacuolar-type H+-ATPase subunit I/STV1
VFRNGGAALKDFISKITFGFLMAQLFPGATTVFAIGFTYFTIETHQPDGVMGTAENVLRTWGMATTPQLLFLVALCIAFGTFIHGLQWAALGALEHRACSAAYETPWYQQPLWKQVLTGPVKIVRELGQLVMLTKGTGKANMYESVTAMDARFMPQFDFLQEFYLATGQFFIHTAYALVAVTGAIATYVVAYGFSWRRVVLLLVVHLLTGLFFVLGRIQMCSLFEAEKTLARKSMRRSQKLPMMLERRRAGSETVPNRDQVSPPVLRPGAVASVLRRTQMKRGAKATITLTK